MKVYLFLLLGIIFVPLILGKIFDWTIRSDYPASLTSRFCGYCFNCKGLVKLKYYRPPLTYFQYWKGGFNLYTGVGIDDVRNFGQRGLFCQHCNSGWLKLKEMKSYDVLKDRAFENENYIVTNKNNDFSKVGSAPTSEFDQMRAVELLKKNDGENK